MSDPDVNLIERLRQAPPFQEGVDFAAVARDVARHRRVRALGAVGGGVAAVVLGLGIFSNALGGLRPGGATSVAAQAGSAEGSSGLSAKTGAAESRAGANPVALCPESVTPDPEVPAQPSGDVGEAFVASRHLVPTTVPMSAVMCTYQIVTFTTGGGSAPPAGSAHPLFSAVRVSSGLDRLARDLSGLPPERSTSRACTLMAGPVDAILLRLDYTGGGTVWVKALTDVNRCTPTTNGSFVTDWYGGDAFQSAAQTAQWTVVPPDPPGAPSAGPTP